MGKEYDGIHRTTFVINEEGFIDERLYSWKPVHAAQILNNTI
jgi:peroxiredoxin Q/BCP